MNKLLLVDDHRIFTDGMHFLIENTTDLQVVGVLHRGNEVLPFLTSTPANIIVLDIDLPDISGFEVALKVKQAHPLIKILVLSMLDDLGSIEQMFRAQADGFCLKSDGRYEIFKAIQTVLDGGVYWPPMYLRLLKDRTEKLTDLRLTTREAEIIKLICSGASSPEIATRLYLSTRTIETHRRNIYRKLKVHTTVELTLYAKKYKIV